MSGGYFPAGALSLRSVFTAYLGNPIGNLKTLRNNSSYQYWKQTSGLGSGAIFSAATNYPAVPNEFKMSIIPSSFYINPTSLTDIYTSIVDPALPTQTKPTPTYVEIILVGGGACGGGGGGGYATCGFGSGGGGGGGGGSSGGYVTSGVVSYSGQGSVIRITAIGAGGTFTDASPYANWGGAGGGSGSGGKDGGATTVNTFTAPGGKTGGGGGGGGANSSGGGGGGGAAVTGGNSGTSGGEGGRGISYAQPGGGSGGTGGPGFTLNAVFYGTGGNGGGGGNVDQGGCHANGGTSGTFGTVGAVQIKWYFGK